MSKFKEVLNSATMGQAKKLRPMILWTMLEYFLKGAPVGVSLLIIWEIFRPLEQPGTTLNVGNIMLACVALLVVMIINYFVSVKAFYASYIEGYSICRDGRISIADHLRRLPMGFYNSRDPGDIGAYVVADYANIEMLLTHLVPKFIGALAMPMVAIVSMLFVNWKLALAAAVVIPLAYPAVLMTNYLVAHCGKSLQKIKISAASRMIEYIEGIRWIKAFNLGGTRFERLEKVFSRLKRDAIVFEAAPAPTIVLATIILNGGVLFIMLLGLSMLMGAEISIATYIMFLLMAMVIYFPLQESMTFLAEINYMKLSVDRVENLRLTPPLAEGEINTATSHEIEFKNVSFGYSPTIPVIRDISIKIPSNSLTAFIGPSGSGKTTLTRLIARFWDVDSGEVLLGGKNIKSYSVDALMSQISIVFQDVYLFKDSIFNNIRIGREEATEAEVIAAAKAAHCHDFIQAMPKQYETMVGEGGSTLSGGEKQRISIARAVLKNAPIILLDEATASLDPSNEIYIQKAISHLVRNRTVIVIAHRLNTVMQADNIVVIDKGRIVQQGRHEDLLASGGLYSQLWHEQQRCKGWKF